MRIPISFGRLTPLLVVFGMTRSGSYVDVGADVVVVRAGPWFRSAIPREAVVRVERGPRRRVSIGVHGWGHEWLVNGAAGPIARLVIRPAAPARVLGVRVRLETLEVSVEEPEALARALGQPLVEASATDR